MGQKCINLKERHWKKDWEREREGGGEREGEKGKQEGERKKQEKRLFAVFDDTENFMGSEKFEDRLKVGSGKTPIFLKKETVTNSKENKSCTRQEIQNIT